MELILIRHGRVASGKRYFNDSGRSDQPLGEIGIDQAARVLDRLEGKQIDAIYVSSLTRTHETAAPLAMERGLTPIEREDLSEVFLGDYEGQSFAQMLRDQEPTYLKFIQERKWETFPGAETDAEVRARVTTALDEIVAANQGQTVAVFTHGGIINAFLAIVMGTERMILVSPENASVTSIWMVPAPPLVVAVNDTSHLPDRDPLRHGPMYEAR